MSTFTTLEGMIVLTPGSRSSRPVIRDTGVSVRAVVGYYKLGSTPEEIAGDLGVELAGIYAALAYYHLNTEEIEAEIIANSEAAVRRELLSE